MVRQLAVAPSAQVAPRPEAAPREGSALETEVGGSAVTAAARWPAAPRAAWPQEAGECRAPGAERLPRA
jgi:hypothetical protein